MLKQVFFRRRKPPKSGLLLDMPLCTEFPPKTNFLTLTPYTE